MKKALLVKGENRDNTVVDTLNYQHNQPDIYKFLRPDKAEAYFEMVAEFYRGVGEVWVGNTEYIVTTVTIVEVEDGS